MSLRRKIEIGALLGAALAAGLAWAWRRRDGADRSRLAAIRAQLAAAEGRSQTARRQEEELARHRVLPAPPAPVAKGPTWFQRLRNDPELQNRMIAAARARFAIQYAPYFAQQKLTPDQARQFLENLSRRDSAQMDLRSIMEEKGLRDDDPVVMQMRGQIFRDFAAAQTSLLGAAGYQQSRDFEKTAYAESVMSNVAGTAALAGVPLEPAQVRQLIDAAAAVQQSTHEDPITQWPKIMAQAQAFLTPAQLDVVAGAERNGNGSGGYRLQQLSAAIRKFSEADAAARIAGAAP